MHWPVCLFPLALSECDANSKQVQISLLSKICHKRHIHSHFGSAHFQQCEQKWESVATTGSPREPPHPLESGGGTPVSGREALARWAKPHPTATSECGFLTPLLENWNSDPEKLNDRREGPILPWPLLLRLKKLDMNLNTLCLNLSQVPKLGRHTCPFSNDEQAGKHLDL